MLLLMVVSSIFGPVQLPLFYMVITVHGGPIPFAGSDVIYIYTYRKHALRMVPHIPMFSGSSWF